MAHQVEFKWGSKTTKGNFRANNEDNLYVSSDAKYFLVADGMGGQSAGEKASELAIELISEKLDQWVDFSDISNDPVPAIDRAVSHANSEIMALGELEPNYKNMGTTITFIVVVDQELYVGGVGDSRVYRLRDGLLEQLTEDHSLTQALVKAGTISIEEASTHRYRNVLYRYLGSKDGGTGTEAMRITPIPGDRYMLCSDGICDGATDGVIQGVLEAFPDPQVATEELIKAAEKGGSKDNITCVVVDVHGDD